MTPLDIYKKLPRKNCGKCSAGTCMAFAVQLLRRMIPVSECPELDELTKKEIDAMLPGAGDWKERRVQELFQQIVNMKFAEISEGLGVVGEEDFLKIRYMGKDVIVTHSDFREDLDIWDKLLILMYIKNAGKKPLSGKWVAFRDLKDGIIRSESFHEACELSLARMFGKDYSGLLERIFKLDGKEVQGFSAGHSLIKYPLPKIPFLVLLWPGDEEFAPDCKILFDATVTDFLDVEALLYLGIAVVRAVNSKIIS